MRVLPWNQGLLPLAPSKREECEGGGGRGCAAFFFKSWRGGGGGRRRKDGGGGTLPVKVEAVHPSSGSVGAGLGNGSPMPPPAAASANGGNFNEGFSVGGDGAGVVKTCLKSSLKKPRGASGGSLHPGKRKVQWTDSLGQELVQVREFEMSDSSGSDDEDDGGVNHGCGCIIQ